MKSARIGLALLLAVGVAGIAETGETPDLRCELRLNSPVLGRFSPKGNSHLHFLLFSKRAGLKVYEDWNSWGYFARSFMAKSQDSKTYIFRRARNKVWYSNTPSTVTLNEGEFLITDIFICDGTWRVAPKLPHGKPLDSAKIFGPVLTLQVTGRFTEQADMKDDPFHEARDLWTGQIESNSVEVDLDNACVDLLNSADLTRK